MSALEVHSLTKHYGPNRGIEDITFAIPRGEIFGYLGPNGSGKTTTLRCIMGLLRPSGGEMVILGQKVRPYRATQHERIGYLPGEFRIWRGCRAERSLSVLAALGRATEARERRRRLADRLQLDLARPVGQLSKGNRQKVGVLYAFQHRPDVLVLDEPTSGLDPLMRQVVLELIREAATEGTTVLLSSHDLSEVSAVCNRAAILREGRLVEVASIASIVQREEHHLKVGFKEGTLMPELPGELRQAVRILHQSPGELHLAYRGDCDRLLRWVASQGVDRIETPRTSLEEAFLGYYSRPSSTSSGETSLPSAPGGEL